MTKPSFLSMPSHLPIPTGNHFQLFQLVCLFGVCLHCCEHQDYTVTECFLFNLRHYVIICFYERHLFLNHQTHLVHKQITSPSPPSPLYSYLKRTYTHTTCIFLCVHNMYVNAQENVLKDNIKLGFRGWLKENFILSIWFKFFTSECIH